VHLFGFITKKFVTMHHGHMNVKFILISSHLRVSRNVAKKLPQFYVFCTVHCAIILQHKPTKCTIF